MTAILVQQQTTTAPPPPTTTTTITTGPTRTSSPASTAGRSTVTRRAEVEVETNVTAGNVVPSLQPKSPKIKNLLDRWERRVSTSDIPDIVRLASTSKLIQSSTLSTRSLYPSTPPFCKPTLTSRNRRFSDNISSSSSNRNYKCNDQNGDDDKDNEIRNSRKKSTRQTIEDLSIFASPRIIHKKLHQEPNKHSSKPTNNNPSLIPIPPAFQTKSLRLSSNSNANGNSGNNGNGARSSINSSNHSPRKSIGKLPSSSPSSEAEMASSSSSTTTTTTTTTATTPQKVQENLNHGGKSIYSPKKNVVKNDAVAKQYSPWSPSKTSLSPSKTSWSPSKTTVAISPKPLLSSRNSTHATTSTKSSTANNISTINDNKSNDGETDISSPTTITTPKRNSVLDRCKVFEQHSATNSPIPVASDHNSTHSNSRRSTNSIGGSSSTSHYYKDNLNKSSDHSKQKTSTATPSVPSNNGNKKQKNHINTLPPWITNKAMKPHGKRSSVLDRFSPTAKTTIRPTIAIKKTPSSLQQDNDNNKSKASTLPMAPPIWNDNKNNSAEQERRQSTTGSTPFFSSSKQEKEMEDITISKGNKSSNGSQDKQQTPSKQQGHSEGILASPPSVSTMQFQQSRSFEQDDKSNVSTNYDNDNDSPKAPTTTTATTSVTTSPKKEKKPAKINRDEIVLQEINKMIHDAEEYEIEDDMDPEVVDCLRQAALKSPAYTKHWYDAVTDSFLHVPTLASIIMDFSLLELAEELYGEELPMLYTVSIRSIAAEIAQDEEELPEYILKLAD